MFGGIYQNLIIYIRGIELGATPYVDPCEAAVLSTPSTQSGTRDSPAAEDRPDPRSTIERAVRDRAHDTEGPETERYQEPNRSQS